MNIGSLYIPWPVILVIVGLILFMLLQLKRTVSHDGKWENGKHAWTDNCTGTSFPGGAIIGAGELSKRRKKFRKSAWSWPTTIVVCGAIAALQE